MMRPIRIAALLAVCLAAQSVPALAHPHVFVTARAEVLYGPDGKVTGVRHAWTFDKVYSAYITQGLDTNKDGKLTPDELQELARENTTSLVEFDYFTVVKANGAKQAFGQPRDYGMSYGNEEATLSYVLPLKTPASNKLVTVEIYDPSYFVAFAVAEGDDAVKLAGAPKGCSTTITRPKPIETAQQQSLSESFFQALDAASNYGSQFSNRALVACP
jgi:ABC-type uncharacterized transport system substrate-binding protein